LAWSIEFEAAAKKKLASLDKPVAKRITAFLRERVAPLEDPRAIGEALLDQRVIAGIGNLYKAETLFLVGVSPWRATADVADPTKLVRLARRLMLANAARSGQVTTGDTRPGHTTWVYGRGGRFIT